MTPAEHEREVFRIRPLSAEEVRRLTPFEVTEVAEGHPDPRAHASPGLFGNYPFDADDDWRCDCGRLRGVGRIGEFCTHCGLPAVFLGAGRLVRIELASPVVNPLFVPALAAALNYTPAALRRLVSCEVYAVLRPGSSGHAQGTFLSEEEYREVRCRVAGQGPDFRVEVGASAVLELLDQVNEADLRNAVLDCVAVLPPRLRPVERRGGEWFAEWAPWPAAGILRRNERLRRLVELNAPEVIVRNEKRMLQRCVDALFSNAALRLPVDRLLNRTVDYSAAGTLVPDPGLAPGTVGIPLETAVELFRPRLLARLATSEHERRLIDLLRPRDRGGLDEAFLAAMRLYRALLDGLGDLLVPLVEDVMSLELLVVSPHHDRPGPMVALRPVLTPDPVVRLHPEVITLLEATVGQAVRLHLPLSAAAQEETDSLLGLHRLRAAARAAPPSAATAPQPRPGVVGWFQAARAGRKALVDARREKARRRREARRAYYGDGLWGELLLGDPLAALAGAAVTGEAIPADSFVARWVRGAVVPPQESASGTS